MAKPIINYIYPFDATTTKQITFTYTGDLPYRNRLIIYNATTLSVIYDITSPSRVLYCTLPADTCINGQKYAAAVQCFDSEGVASAVSDKAYFWCMEQPSFYFLNVTDGETITSSSFFAELFYAQTQGEVLSQFQYFIYDSSKVLLSASQIFYSTDYLTYNYTALEDDTVYYIRAKGLTQYGTALDTGYIEINVDTSYDNADYNNINALCNENNSIVTYYTNFTIVNSDEDGSLYDYDDSYINLVGKSLHYTTGIDLSGNFLLCIRIKEFYDTATLLQVADDNYAFTLSSYVYDDYTMRFKLTVPNGIESYILYSEPYIPNATTVFTIYIQRGAILEKGGAVRNVSDLYQLHVFTTEQDDTNDMHWGTNEPDASLADVYDVWVTNENTPTVEIKKENIHRFIRDDEPVVLAKDLYDIWIGRSDDT